MEKALRYELNSISEINNKIFPTNAPQGKEPPYLVYTQSYFNQLKTLDGLKNSFEASYLLNVLSNTYSEAKDITEKVKSIIKTFPLRIIGTGEIYVQDINFNNISETYENEINLYRSIIDVTFYFKN